MRLSTDDGIACDECGSSHRLNFTYYSFDFRSVEYKLPLGQIFNLPITRSIDVCQLCFEKYKQLVINNNASLIRNKKICELSGDVINGHYYYAAVTKAVVTANKSKSLVVSVDKRHLEFSLSKNEYDKLKVVPASGWDTRSDS